MFPLPYLTVLSPLSCACNYLIFSFSEMKAEACSLAHVLAASFLALHGLQHSHAQLPAPIACKTLISEVHTCRLWSTTRELHYLVTARTSHVILLCVCWECWSCNVLAACLTFPCVRSLCATHRRKSCAGLDSTGEQALGSHSWTLLLSRHQGEQLACTQSLRREYPPRKTLCVSSCS